MIITSNIKPKSVEAVHTYTHGYLTKYTINNKKGNIILLCELIDTGWNSIVFLCIKNINTKMEDKGMKNKLYKNELV